MELYLQNYLFFSLRLTKSESGHAFSLIRQKSTWCLVGKMMILPHFTLLMLSSYRLVMAHLDSGSRYIVWYFIDIEYRHLVSDSLTPLVAVLLSLCKTSTLGQCFPVFKHRELTLLLVWLRKITTQTPRNSMRRCYRKEIGTSSRHCSQLPLGGHLATILVDCYC